MINLKELGIRQKFVGTAFLLFLATSVFVIIFFPLRQGSQMFSYLEEKALVIGKMAASSSSAGLMFEDVSSVEDALRNVDASEDVKFAVILKDDDSQFAIWTKVDIDDDHLQRHVKEALNKTEDFSAKKHGDALITKVPVMSGNDRLGTLVLGMSLESLDEDLARNKLIAFWAALSILLVGCVMFYVLSNRIVGTLLKSVNIITSSTSEIASTIEEQERIASQQSSSVAQTTTTMEELGVSAQQSTEQTNMAAQESQLVLEMAEKGVETTNQAQNSMVNLKEKVSAIAEQILQLSEQISQISNVTSIVNDIANQINLLALNASVEAARAGEHGKGFAVVASEIRKLADQSKKSSEKIDLLVKEIQRATNSTVMATEEGTKTVDETAQITRLVTESFYNISNSATKSSENVQQIALNIQQQGAAISQVVSAMNSLNSGARETATGINRIKIGIEHAEVGTKALSDMI